MPRPTPNIGMRAAARRAGPLAAGALALAFTLAPCALSHGGARAQSFDPSPAPAASAPAATDPATGSAASAPATASAAPAAAAAAAAVAAPAPKRKKPRNPTGSPLDTIMQTRLFADVPEAKDFVREKRPAPETLEFKPTWGRDPVRPKLRTSAELGALQSELESAGKMNEARGGLSKAVKASKATRTPAAVAGVAKAADKPGEPSKASAN